MVDFKNAQLYNQDSVDKQLKITFDGGTITNSDLHSEQFELTESLTSESQLVFGSCEASEVKFRISNVFIPLKDKWLSITQTLNGDTENPLQIGRYKVYSDKPTADRSYRDVVAYDSMYDIINTDVASWYNGLILPMSLKAFRDSFFAFFGIEQENVSLVNDLMNIERTIEPQTLSGRDVIASICELNGCFGNIGRDGKFQYITLKKITSGMYPSNDIYPADNLFPQQPNMQMLGSGLYVSTPTYEDFTVKPIDKLQIREKEGDIGVIVGDGYNTYIVEDNFLVYGKSTEDLTVIANNVLSVIEKLEYRPFDARLVGNPCFEVGDAIRLHTKHQVIDSYVLQRTLRGIQALRDDWSADGEEYQSKKVNDIQTQITQLKGKTNVLERTVDETRSTIIDVENGLQSQITQTADSIRSEVSAIEKSLQDQIDGVLGQYSGSEVPTLENYPASEWTTTQQKDAAIGSLYFVNSEGGDYAGFAYRWEKLSDETYQWALLRDTEITQALKELEELQNKLQNEYSTTVEMNSAIDQSADRITSTVSETQSKWDLGKYEGSALYYGYGEPTIPVPFGPYNYINLLTGEVYSPGVVEGGSPRWYKTGQLKEVKKVLQSSIDQTAQSIRMEVSNIEDELYSSIAQTAQSIRLEVAEETNELSSEIEQLANQIVLSVDAKGKIVSVKLFADPSTGSEFKVDADNINLSANDVINLLSGGTINLSGKNITITSDNLLVNKDGLTINGGDIVGSNISASDTFKMRCYHNAISSEYLPVISTQREYGGPATVVMIGNENFPTVLKGIPRLYNNSTYHNIIYDGGTKPSLPSLQYLAMESKNDGTIYIHAQTTSRAYGITIWESDTKLKKNIKETAQVALDKVKQLEYVQFDWKESNTHVDLGLSANQVEEIIPDAVFEVKQDRDYETLKNIDSQVLTVYSLKAIQEMSQIIENQQFEIDELKKSVSFLMEKLGGNVDG